MKARREKKRAAIPKFSPAVREWGSGTENKSTKLLDLYACEIHFINAER